MVRKIIFGILYFISLLFFVFYLDLANGPLWVFILSMVGFLAYLIIRVIFWKKSKIITTLMITLFICFNGLIVLLARPEVKQLNATLTDEIYKTEELKLKNFNVFGSYSTDKKVEIYAGIPYAKAPVNELRWHEPVEIGNIDETLDCTKFKARCIQKDTNPIFSSLVDIYAAKRWIPNYNMTPLQNMSEDCLYLNIWKPKGNVSNLPILVYYHGGSLTNGSSAYVDYNGEAMAKKNVIMITVSYRLGVFGYFAHNELINESSNNTTGNYGLLDQICALKWVNDNASFFGGDKNNITIAGESAGSSCISAMCTSKLAKGLFKNAIGESSSLATNNPPHTFRSLDNALKMGNDIMKEFRASNINDLRKVDALDLVNTKYTNNSMTLDGYALSKTPYQVYKDKENNETNLLNGFNVLEADAFTVSQYLLNPTNKNNIKERLEQVFKNKSDDILALYDLKTDDDAFKAFNEVFSAYWFFMPHYSWSHLAYDNGVNVYKYQFMKTNGYYQNYHSGEMVYCYGNLDKKNIRFAFNSSDYKLSEIMLDYWANFVKYGNPNGEGLPNWEKYNSSENLIELSENIHMKEDPYLALYEVLKDYR